MNQIKIIIPIIIFIGIIVILIVIGEVSENVGDNNKLFDQNAHSKESISKIKSLFPTAIDGEIIYPDFVGGLYINSEHYLVIQIVQDNIPNEISGEYPMYRDVIEVDDNAIIEYVEYSYKALNEVRDFIENYFKNNYIEDFTFGNPIATLSVDAWSNIVVVGLKDYKELDVTRFKNLIIDSPLITFKEEEEQEAYNDH